GPVETKVITSPTQVRGVDQTRTGLVELGDEGVEITPAVGGLEGAGCRRKVGGTGVAFGVDLTVSIRRANEDLIFPAAPEVGRVDEGRSGRIELRYEAVMGPSTVDALKGAGCRREVLRRRRPHDIDVVVRVGGHTDGDVVSRTPDVGREHQPGALGVELGDKDVVEAACVRSLESAGRRGEIGGIGIAGQIDVARGIKVHIEGKVVAAAAQVGGVAEDGVDHQGRVGVIGAQVESDSLTCDHISNADQALDSLHHLVYMWSRLDEFNPGDDHPQITCSIDPHLLCSGHRPANLTGIALGRNDEIVFELALSTVVHERDAWIEVAIDDLRVGGDAGAPLTGVAPHEVVDLTGKLGTAGHHRLRICANELETEHRLCGGVLAHHGSAPGDHWLLQSQHGLRWRQEDGVTAPARQEVDAWIRLARVSLEA
ncbi:MAG TPA: hypothetical protein VIY29_19930, partial [Ktedonobacteraceae bacterium]